MSESDRVSSLEHPVLIVDGANAFVRAYCAYPSVSSHGYQLGGYAGFIKSLTRMVSDFSPASVIIAWEGGGSSRRRKIYPDYKMNRRPWKLNRFYSDDIPDSDENRVHQMIALVKFLKCLPVWQLYADDAEGDDVVGFLVCGPLAGRCALIASSDKDMHQLLSSSVSQYSLHKKTVITERDVYDQFGVLAENFSIAKAICGDKGDNIDGVSRVGFKTLSKHMPILRTGGVLLDEALSYAASHRSSSLVCARIAESEELIRRNWQLVRLDASTLSAHRASTMLSSLAKPRGGVDVLGMRSSIIAEGASGINLDEITTTFARYSGCQRP